MSQRQPWSPNEADVEYYTEGYCWSLAWSLSRLTGGTIVSIGLDRKDWTHVLVRIGRRYLDILGWHSLRDLKEGWGLHKTEWPEFGSYADYSRMIHPDCVCPPDRRRRHTHYVANRVVRAYV